MKKRILAASVVLSFVFIDGRLAFLVFLIVVVGFIADKGDFRVN